jgi:hypothetical protein
LTREIYGSTFVFSSNATPSFSFTTLSYPFYVYVKNSADTMQTISVNNGVSTYFPRGPVNCNLYPAVLTLTRNSALTILYASDATTWNLF